MFSRKKQLAVSINLSAPLAQGSPFAPLTSMYAFTASKTVFHFGSSSCFSSSTAAAFSQASEPGFSPSEYEFISIFLEQLPPLSPPANLLWSF